MSDINMEKILNGTSQKIFDNKYNAMSTDYNEDTALEFFNSYKDAPLSFILKNAEKIIKESIYGTSFFLELIRGLFIPFHRVNEIIKIAEDVIAVGKNSKIPDTQLYQYETIYSDLVKITELYKNTIDLYNIAISENGGEILDTFHDYAYDISKNGTEEEYRGIIYGVLQNVPNAYINMCVTVYSILHGELDNFGFIRDFILPEYNYWYENDKSAVQSEVFLKKYKYDARNAIRKVNKDEAINKAFNEMPHNTKYLLLGICSTEDVKPELKTESVEDVGIYNTGELINEIIKEEDDPLFNESVSNRKIGVFEHLISLKAWYESKRDLAIRESGDEVIVEKCNDCIDELDGQIAMMEWTEDGEPDPTLKKHIMTKKQIDKEKKEKDDKKNSAKEEAEKKTEEDDLEDDEDVEEKEITGKNKSFRKQALQKAYKVCRGIGDGCREHVVKAEEEKFTEGKSNSLCLGSFKKDQYNDVLKALRDAFKESKDISIMDDNYYTIFIQVKNKSEYFMEATVVFVPQTDPNITNALAAYQVMHKNDNNFILLPKLKKKTFKIKDGKREEKPSKFALVKTNFVEEFFYNDKPAFSITYKHPYVGNYAKIEFQDSKFKKHAGYYLTRRISSLKLPYTKECTVWVHDTLGEGEKKFEERRKQKRQKKLAKKNGEVVKEATEVDDEGNMRQIGNDEEKKPEKPKEDFATRVQNKAIDRSAKSAEKRALNKEKRTKLKNAGKAVSEGPKQDIKGVKKFFDDIGKWDVKRRKEFFLKPGYRHKIFRNMRLALMYGMGGIKYMPTLLLFRHFSKDKDKRIRNETIRELDTEIRICEEKINDANSNGDQQEKYKMMRIKDKLLAEKNRVQLNSKYI